MSDLYIIIVWGVRMNKRQESALKTRQKLIDTTDKLIREYGFNALSVDKIIQEANVAKGTFYVYFKHKEDIVFELCKNLYKKTELRIGNMKNASIEEKLHCYIEGFILNVESYKIHIAREWIKGIVEKNQNGESIGSIRRQYDLETLKSFIDQAIKDKELNKYTPVDKLTNIIISQLYGIITCWCMSDSDFDLKGSMKDFCDVCSRIIGSYKK